MHNQHETIADPAQNHTNMAMMSDINTNFLHRTGIFKTAQAKLMMNLSDARHIILNKSIWNTLNIRYGNDLTALQTALY